MRPGKRSNPNAGIYHYYNSDVYYSYQNVNNVHKMDGMKRVIVFCILIVVLPATLIILPLYLRKTVFGDVVYPVAESDIIEIRDGISSIFCQRHSLQMDSSFNAFQLHSRPEISTNRKHIRLKKSMTLPDDTLEYWGFFLLKGAKVHLKFCSRYDGSRILVVKGQRDLQTCNLLDHNKNKVGANFAQGHEQVKVFFEDITEIGTNIPMDELDLKVSNNGTRNGADSMEMENLGGEDNENDDIQMTSSTPPSIPLPRSKMRLRHKLDEATKKPTEVPESAESRTMAAIVEPEATVVQHANKEDAQFRQNHQTEKDRKRRQVYDQLYKRRSKREHVYDRKYSHGGNAVNFTASDESNSISSFENGLFECFNGAILLAEGFPPSPECVNAHFLENGSQRMLSKHEISEDGYYYYIFYSDNDLVRNDIHAIFDIYKPTFQYSNLSDSQGCVNVTNCSFPIGFLSNDIVIVEVPTRDGIEHEEDDITYLISTCHPRPEIYAIFPITVLILIISCSFI